jgi:hypothetical protein
MYQKCSLARPIQVAKTSKGQAGIAAIVALADLTVCRGDAEIRQSMFKSAFLSGALLKHSYLSRLVSTGLATTG